jgi:hypothetical protein
MSNPANPVRISLSFPQLRLLVLRLRHQKRVLERRVRSQNHLLIKTLMELDRDL